MPTHLVIDADGHCNEPDTGLVKWLPKEYAHLAPNRVTDSSGYSHLMTRDAWRDAGAGAEARIAAPCLPIISREAGPA